VPIAQVSAQPPPVSPAAEAVTPLVDEQGYQILSKEEKVEYRDENGNVLDDAQVEALRGQVEFQTRYETRTRLVDGDGKEIYNKVVEGSGPEIAGLDEEPHVAEKPEPEPETAPAQVPIASDVPAHVNVEDDLQKEQHLAQADTAAAAAVPEENPEVAATA
jgi:dolichyl-phosphate-mannose-protein mannosyltransferase